jgi:hypothetical protein
MPWELKTGKPLRDINKEKRKMKGLQGKTSGEYHVDPYGHPITSMLHEADF